MEKIESKQETQTKTQNNKLYSILIPTYEERQNIGILIHLINQNLSPKKINFEIIIVDDNSPDNTREIVLQMKEFYKFPIKLLDRPGKLGLGSAYQDGFKICEGDFIIIMDADFSHYPSALPEFIKKQEETNCDIVTGTRYTNGGGKLNLFKKYKGVYGWNIIRKFISRGANFYANFFLKTDLSDLTGSFRLYKRSVFEELIKKIKCSGYAFQMEIVVRALYSGYSIEEVMPNT